VAVSLGAGQVRAEFLNPTDFTSLGAVPAGPLTINTDTNTLTNGVVTLHGVSGGNAAVFTFDSIPSFNVTSITGSHPLAVLSYGDITVDGTVNVSAGDSAFNGPGGLPGPGGIPSNSPIGGAVGGLGGAGRPLQNPGLTGNGGSPGGLVGGYGIGFPPGQSYGGGGGAVEFVALGHVTISGAIIANGGRGGGASGFGFNGGGGGGGGGGILIKGDSVSIPGGLTADGGNGGPAGVAGAGGGGGGGQVQIAAGPGGFDLSGGIGVVGGSGGPASFPGPNGGGQGGNGGQGGTIRIESAGPLRLTGGFSVAGGAGVVAGPPGTLTIVPEPSSLALMALGVLSLLGPGLHRK
jgi:hypothetical protein